MPNQDVMVEYLIRIKTTADYEDDVKAQADALAQALGFEGAAFEVVVERGKATIAMWEHEGDPAE